VGGAHGAEEQQRLVDEVAAEVAQQAAAGRRRAVVVGEALEARLEVRDVSELAGSQQPADGQQVRAPAAVLAGWAVRLTARD